MFDRLGTHFGLLSAAVLLMLGASSARADISFVNMFRSASLTQTGNGNSLTANGYFFSSTLFSSGANDFNSVQMTYPGPGSPVNLGQTSPTTYTVFSRH